MTDAATLLASTDVIPATLATAAASADGCGNPHVHTLRTMNAYTGGGPDLIWNGAAGNQTKAAITGFGTLDGYRGVLVRDDYGGYLSYDAGLAGVQQRLAHLYRYPGDARAATHSPPSATPSTATPARLQTPAQSANQAP